MRKMNCGRINLLVGQSIMLKEARKNVTLHGYKPLMFFEEK